MLRWMLVLLTVALVYGNDERIQHARPNLINIKPTTRHMLLISGIMFRILDGLTDLSDNTNVFKSGVRGSVRMACLYCLLGSLV